MKFALNLVRNVTIASQRPNAVQNRLERNSQAGLNPKAVLLNTGVASIARLKVVRLAAIRAVRQVHLVSKCIKFSFLSVGHVCCLHALNIHNYREGVKYYFQLFLHSPFIRYGSQLYNSLLKERGCFEKLSVGQFRLC